MGPWSQSLSPLPDVGWQYLTTCGKICLLVNTLMALSARMSSNIGRMYPSLHGLLAKEEVWPKENQDKPACTLNRSMDIPDNETMHNEPVTCSERQRNIVVWFMTRPRFMRTNVAGSPRPRLRFPSPTVRVLHSQWQTLCQ